MVLMDMLHVADHIISTMAIAEEVGVLSLARLWWRRTIGEDELALLANREIARHMRYLYKAWDAKNKELLVGIGDQSDDDGLVAYKDFGTAGFALQVLQPTLSQTTHQSHLLLLVLCT
jgi:hypothetical protein